MFGPYLSAHAGYLNFILTIGNGTANAHKHKKEDPEIGLSNIHIHQTSLEFSLIAR